MTTSHRTTVAVVGASERPDRLSGLACQTLVAGGHKVYAVSLEGRDMHGAIGCRSIAEIEERLDTVTLYVGAARQAALLDALVAKRPGRVIFNPGAESSESERRLHAAGIETLHACTLVLLRSGEF